MGCLADHQIMNYRLGRACDAEVRQHIARCKKCKSRLAVIEDTLIEEAGQKERYPLDPASGFRSDLPMQGQAGFFGS